MLSLLLVLSQSIFCSFLDHDLLSCFNYYSKSETEFHDKGMSLVQGVGLPQVLLGPGT